jgi:hypothetical protein
MQRHPRRGLGDRAARDPQVGTRGAGAADFEIDAFDCDATIPRAEPFRPVWQIVSPIRGTFVYAGEGCGRGPDGRVQLSRDGAC